VQNFKFKVENYLIQGRPVKMQAIGDIKIKIFLEIS
jgi:hypothetical protein